MRDMIGASNAASCDRTCLTGAITTYMDALLEHDPSKLPLAETVKFTENGQVMQLSPTVRYGKAHRGRATTGRTSSTYARASPDRTSSLKSMACR